MHTHPNARLTPLSRERLLRRHIDGGEPLKALATQAGISLRTAYKWLARYRSGGHTGLPKSVIKRLPGLWLCLRAQAFLGCRTPVHGIPGGSSGSHRA